MPESAQLDIKQILLEAPHRWLRPAEICEILQNYEKFLLSPEPPNRPPSGSLFLFDRKVLRYFRKDGHNWRKKKDGKTVKEAHERLRAGSIGVLHCYYAHGEENENFERRSYWMLEEDLLHIVLVHYREVKGNRTNFNRIRDADGIPAGRQNEEDISNSEVDSSAPSRFQPYDYQRASPITDTTSLNSTQASELEDAESDIYKRILLEAQHRWLHPAEICEIIQNYKKFHISPEPPSRPASGSFFLFNRKVLRHFRNDGHNWSKKPNGKPMKEGHEKFKAGSIDVLHCYYAHGEENRNFQRRSYWMLGEDLSHIAFVHYLEVKGNRTNFNRSRDADGIPASRQNDEDISNSEVDIPEPSRFQPYDYQRAPPVTDATNLNNTQASEHEDAASAYRHQACPGFQSIHELQSPAMQNMDDGSIPYHPAPGSNNYQGQSSAIPGMSFGSITQGEEKKNLMDNGLTYELQQDLELLSWENLLEISNAGCQSVNFEPSLPSTHSIPMSMMPGQDNELHDQVFSCSFGKKQGFGSHSDGLEEWQASDRDPLHVSKWLTARLCDPTTELSDVNQVEQCDSMVLHDTYLTDQSRQPMQNDLQLQALNDVGSSLESEPNGNLNAEDKNNYPALRQPLLGGLLQEALKRQDSIGRWMSKVLGDFTEDPFTFLMQVKLD